jgi:predicted SprT family Zn-dependent metalloprotease
MADLTRVEHWADALIKLYLDPGVWSFRFDHARTRAGLCDFTHKTISVSRHLAAKYEDDEIHQVLLHEVAHAIAGPKAGHGAKWKEVAKELGYDGKRTHDGSAANELAPWVGTCPAGHDHYRFRKPTRVLSCGACGRGFSRDHVITWVHRDVL